MADRLPGVSGPITCMVPSLQHSVLQQSSLSQTFLEVKQPGKCTFSSCVTTARQQLFMLPPAKSCQQYNCRPAATGCWGFPLINQGGSDALGSLALPPSLLSSKSSWCLIWPGSKGEGQNCPAVLQET